MTIRSPTPGTTDPDYPWPDGQIGVWGHDFGDDGNGTGGGDGPVSDSGISSIPRDTGI